MWIPRWTGSRTMLDRAQVPGPPCQNRAGSRERGGGLCGPPEERDCRFPQTRGKCGRANAGRAWGAGRRPGLIPSGKDGQARCRRWYLSLKVLIFAPT